MGHVVVWREELDLGFAAIDDENDVIDRHRRFGDVRRQDHLRNALVHMAEHLKMSIKSTRECFDTFKVEFKSQLYKYGQGIVLQLSIDWFDK